MLVGLSLVACQSSKRTNQPNLFADDLGYGDLGCYGNPTIQTPNLDRMAREGMKFTNFYAGAPACSASRYSLLTGRYPARSGFGHVLVPNSQIGIHPDEITLAEGLKEMGYHTAIFGKWHLGTTDIAYLPLQNGFDEYFGLPYSNDMDPRQWPEIPLIDGNDTIERNPDQKYLTRRYTERAIDFIRAHKDEPFFLYLPYTMPHTPLHPGPEFEDFSKRGIYGDVVEEIDWSVGIIMGTIRQAEIEEKTLMFFTSDNGPWLVKKTHGGSAGLLREGKGTTWEGGMREPALAWWPGTIDERSLCMEVSSTLDLYSTFLRLAGATIPNDRKVDGRDISQLFIQADVLPEQPWFYHAPKQVQAVRLGHWKLHVKTNYHNKQQASKGKVPLLFNLNEDPSEKYDLAEQHPEKVEELLQIIADHEAEVRQSGTFWDKNHP